MGGGILVFEKNRCVEVLDCRYMDGRWIDMFWIAGIWMEVGSSGGVCAAPSASLFSVGCNFCQLFIPHCNSTIAALIKPATAHHCIWCKMLLDLLTLLTMTVAILLLNNHNNIFC